MVSTLSTTSTSFHQEWLRTRHGRIKLSPQPFANRLMYSAFTNTSWQGEKAAGVNSNDLRHMWQPTVDNLRNFLLKPTTEMLSFLQQM